MMTSGPETSMLDKSRISHFISVVHHAAPKGKVLT